MVAAVIGEPRLQLLVPLDVRGDVEPGGRPVLRGAPERVFRLARSQSTRDEREHPTRLPSPAEKGERRPHEVRARRAEDRVVAAVRDHVERGVGEGAVLLHEDVDWR